MSGALHKPTPHRVPVDLVAPGAVAAGLAARLDALPGRPLAMRRAASAQAAVADIELAASADVRAADS
jgi:hypothetical protein